MQKVESFFKSLWGESKTKKKPELPSKNATLLTKIKALCKAIEYYTPENEETANLIKATKTLKNATKQLPYNEKKIFKLATECKNQLFHLKESLPKEWYENIKPFTQTFSPPKKKTISGIKINYSKK